MSHIRSTSWTYPITLTAQDKLRVRLFIEQETRYFNALVAGMAGPLRTMPETLARMTGRWEEVYGIAAAHGVNPLGTAASKRPKVFEPYSDLLAEEGDMRKSLLLDIATTPATLSHVVRRNMAVEVLRYTREQSVALTNPLIGEESVYRFAVEVLAPYEDGQKRHVQIPVGALKREAVDGGDVTIALPYLGAPVTVKAPPVDWNMAVIREERDGTHVLELCREISTYNVKRMDAAGPRQNGRRRSQRDTSQS